MFCLLYKQFWPFFGVDVPFFCCWCRPPYGSHVLKSRCTTALYFHATAAVSCCRRDTKLDSMTHTLPWAADPAPSEAREIHLLLLDPLSLSLLVLHFVQHRSVLQFFFFVVVPAVSGASCTAFTCVSISSVFNVCTRESIFLRYL